MTLPAATANAVEAVKVAADTAEAEAVPDGREAVVQIDQATTKLRIQLERRAQVPASVGLADVSLEGAEVIPAIATPAADAGDPLSGEMVMTAAPGSRNGCLGHAEVFCSPQLLTTGEDDGGVTRLWTLEEPGSFGPKIEAATTPGEGLDRLIASALPRGVFVESSSQLVPSPMSGPLAALDGDPGTGWIAGEGDEEPALRLTWGRATEVRGLHFQVDESLVGSVPTKVKVDVAGRTYLRAITPGGRVSLPRVKTDHLRFTIVEVVPSFAVDRQGRARVLPAAVSDVAVLGVGPLVDRDRQVFVPCGDGPTLRVDDRAIPTSVATTVDGLMRGEPLAATVCSDQELVLDTGTHLLEFGASSTWRPVRVSLAGAGLTTDSEEVSTYVRAWGDTRRTVEVGPRSSDAVLAIRENANPGWHAEVDGRALRSVTVDGWQQGFVVPAGENALVEVTFGPDRVYRGSILVGFALVAGVGIAALTRGRRSELPPAEPLRLPRWFIGIVLLALTGLLIGGVGGVIVAGCVLLARQMHVRTRPGVDVAWSWAIAAGALTLVAGALLAQAGRVEAGSTYHGLTQLIGIAALTAIVAAGTDPRPSPRPGNDPVDS